MIKVGDLPSGFVRTQMELHGAAGRTWLDRLPGCLEACAQRWGLTLGPAFPNLSYHYAAPATCADGTPVVVKACSPTGEFAGEAGTLRVYDGRGAARLLAVDTEREVMLLERLRPGSPLGLVQDDEEATAIAAGVMRQLWRPVPEAHPFQSVTDWAKGFGRLRERYGGATGPFPRALVEEAERLYADLGASAATPVVLHTDLHHGNILSSGARGWLAIDPKGIVGEREYETGAFLRNGLPEALPANEVAALLQRRMGPLPIVGSRGLREPRRRADDGGRPSGRTGRKGV